jgi:hypothetical protein
MQRLFCAVTVTAMLSACPSQESLCKSGVDQVCEREFECQPQEVKDSTLFKMAFGNSVQECKDALYANPLRPAGATGIACASVKDDAQLCSNLGVSNATSFDLSKAIECRDQRDALECSAFLAQVNPSGPGGQAPPAPCQQRWK